jgi:hypothetical protein
LIAKNQSWRARKLKMDQILSKAKRSAFIILPNKELSNTFDSLPLFKPKEFQSDWFLITSLVYWLGCLIIYWIWLKLKFERILKKCGYDWIEFELAR